MNPEAVEESTLRVVIHSASMNCRDGKDEKDRAEINRKMHDEVLETGFFRQITYECSHVSPSKIGEGQYFIVLTGTLTLHGVERSQIVSARVSLNGDILRAMGDISIRQSQYAIRPVSAAAGAIRVKDEVRLTFDISARKQA